MTSSIKDTFRAVTAVFSAPDSTYSLPPELHLTIESFLDTYKECDDRVHDELLSVYNRYVVDSPEKHSLFIALLRLLRPAIRNEKHLMEWWEMVVLPTLTTLGYRRNEIEDAREYTLGVLVFDPDDDATGEKAHFSSQLLRKLLEEYFTRTTVTNKENAVHLREDEFIANELESIITAYGRKRAKELFIALDDLFNQKNYRLQILNLLSAFIQTHPPHLHLVLHTPLWEHLQRCLMSETSTTVIELALTVLIMLLPHTASNLVPCLPQLYLIYARVLCWDKFQTSPTSPHSDEKAANPQEVDESHFSEKPLQLSDRPQLTAPSVMHYFTFLYGLFPFNFLSFVRKPRKWLKKVEFPGADDFDIDQEVLHERTKAFQQTHLLHPNFYITTLEDELEENRWLKSDPADVVAECMGLCIAVPSPVRTLAPPGPPPTGKLPDLPPLRPTSAGTCSASGSDTKRTETDSPTLPPQSVPGSVEPINEALSAPASPLLSRARSSENVQMFLSVNGPASPTLLVPSQGMPPSSTADALQREIMLLRNDLNFERFLKQQHMSHIGQLQRQNLKEATNEADTQNIINTNRMLKAKVAKANELYAQLKKEVVTSRNQSKKWEADLSAKLRVFKDEQKKWAFDEQTLRLELAKAREDCDRLKELVLESETKELNSKQKLQASRMDLEELENFKQEVEKLRSSLTSYRTQEQEFEQARDERDHLRNELEGANLKLSSRDADLERTHAAYEHRIAELETRLQDQQGSTLPGELPPAVQQMVDSALAGSNAKLQHLKKTHSRLHERYIDLEMRYHELEREMEAISLPGGASISRSRSPRIDRVQDDPGNVMYRRAPSPSGGHYGGYANPRYGKPSLFSNEQQSEDDDYYRTHYAPPSPGIDFYAPQARPVRLESLKQTGGHAGGEQKMLSSARDLSSQRDLAMEYERDLDMGFYQPRAGAEKRASRGKDSISFDSAGSGDRDRKKEKAAPKNQVRVYGRGGAQNVGKSKDKTKDKEADKAHKAGTFRGLRGIM